MTREIPTGLGGGVGYTDTFQVYPPRSCNFSGPANQVARFRHVSDHVGGIPLLFRVVVTGCSCCRAARFSFDVGVNDDEKMFGKFQPEGKLSTISTSPRIYVLFETYSGVLFWRLSFPPSTSRRMSSPVEVGGATINTSSVLNILEGVPVPDRAHESSFFLGLSIDIFRYL